MLPEKIKFRGRTYRKYKVCATSKKAKLWAGDLRSYSKGGSKFGALIKKDPHRDHWIIYWTDLRRKPK